MLRSLAVAGGAFVLVGGAAMAGMAAERSPSAPAPSAAAPQAQVSDAQLAAMVTADEDTAPGTTPPAAAAKLPHRSLCARVPAAITRTQALEKTLAADASTKGSLAFLQARIDTADAAHRTQLAASLRTRLAFRQELAKFLPERLEFLQKAQSTVCAPGAAATS